MSMFCLPEVAPVPPRHAPPVGISGALALTAVHCRRLDNPGLLRKVPWVENALGNRRISSDERMVSAWPTLILARAGGMLIGIAGMAAATSAPGEVTAVFLQYGVLGVFALFGLWFFRTVYKRESERADRAEAALADLNRDVREKVIPVLTEAARATADAAIVMRDARGGYNK